MGKTSLVHLICHGEALGNSSWTIGCSVEVRIHEFREGTPSHRPYFVELWDVGGSGSHRNARHVFYTPVHGGCLLFFSFSFIYIFVLFYFFVYILSLPVYDAFFLNPYLFILIYVFIYCYLFCVVSLPVNGVFSCPFCFVFIVCVFQVLLLSIHVV